MNDPAELKNFHRKLLRRLSGVRRAWRIHAVAHGIAFIIVCAGIPLIIGILAGAGYPWRQILLFISLVAALFFLINNIARPLFKTLRPDDVALFIEAKAPELKDRLVSAVQLLQEQEREEYRADASMLAALAAEADNAAEGVPLKRLFPLGKTAALVSGAAAIAVLGATLCSRSGGATAFVSPPYLPRRERVELAHVTGDVVAPAGGSVTISASFAEDLKTAPSLLIIREGLPPSETRMHSAPRDRREFRVLLRDLTGSLSYRVAYRDFRSRPYRIKVVEPPHILSLRMSLAYPAYTGLLPETKEENGDIQAPVGTRVRLEVTGSSPIGRAAIEFIGVRSTGMSLKGDRIAAGVFTVSGNGRYRVRLTDRYGFSNTDPPVYRIAAAPDQPPQIELLQPDRDVSIPKTTVISLKGTARDDYGVTRVTLRWRLLQSNHKGSAIVPVAAGPELTFDFPWDMNRVDATPGDAIEYSLTAADNCRAGGPHSSSTPPRRITLLSRVDDYKDIEATQKDWMQNLGNIIGEGNDIAEKFEAVNRDIASGKLTGGRKDQDVQRLVQREQQLEQESSQLSDSMKEVLSRMKENDLISPEALQKMSEISRLMDSVMTKEMRQKLESLQNSLQKMDLTGMDPQVMQQVADQRNIMNSLDHTLERLKRVLAEQKMDMLAKHLSELEERQKKVADRAADLKRKETRGGLTPPDREEADRQSREESRIESEAADDLARMDDLSETMKDADPKLSDTMKQMSEKARADQLPQNLNGAAQSLRDNHMSAAENTSRKAHQTLREMADQMGAERDRYAQRLNDEVKRLIRAALEKTLNISDTQENIMDRAERLKNRSPDTLGSDETAPVAEAQQFAQSVTRRLASDIAHLTSLSGVVNVSLAGDTDAVADTMARAVERESKRQPGEAWSAMRQAYLGLNRVALSLAAARDAAGTMPASSEAEAFMRQLEQLAQSQQALNGQTGALGSGAPTSAMLDALRALAMQQRVIREGLSQLAQNMRAMGKISDRLGNLTGEMEDIERQLAAGNAGQEVRRRQSAVLRRLQDATLALRRDSREDEKRRAVLGKEYAPTAPKTASTPTKKSLPESARVEAEQMRKAPRPKGFDRAIDRYYDELFR